MPKVSVLMPAYNHEKFVAEAIQSVLSQTYDDFEFIIWDDCSTDRTWEIISSFADPRIKKFRNPTNVRNVLNDSLSVASGELIAIQHSDDIWVADKLDKQVRHLRDNPACGAVFSHAIAIDERGQSEALSGHLNQRIFQQPNRTRFEWLNHFFYNHNSLCHPSAVIRRKCYDSCGGYPFGFFQLRDFAMWIKICMHFEIFVLDEKLVKFRVLDGEMNVSGARPATIIRDSIEAFQLYREFLKLDSFEELCAVFPCIRSYYRPNGMDKNYLLAMAALDHDVSPARALFGINLLFEIMADTKRAQKVKDLYGFSYLDLPTILARHDVFHVLRPPPPPSVPPTIVQRIRRKSKRLISTAVRQHLFGINERR